MPLRIAHPAQQKRVLLIEDNRLTLALLRTVLRAEGYDVLEAATASEGLDAALRYRPDLVVMDIRLPDRSGFEVTRILKAEAATHSISVVITSAYGSAADKDRPRECGCDSYIPAPISIGPFVDVIQSFMGPPDSTRLKEKRDY